MTATTTAPRTVLDELLTWSANRPAWQRDALRRIVQGGRLSDTDIRELSMLCKQGREEQNTGRIGHPLKREHLPGNPKAGDDVTLVAIKEASSVNNLASNQDLRFAPTGLTIIYGDNGTGKSGYARIMKRACRARQPGAAILPNIYAAPSNQRPSATICYCVGGAEQAPLAWLDSGKSHPVLSAISVFDADCAAIHIDAANEVAFKPFGLDVPDELAGACQRVKELLSAEKKTLEESRDSLFSRPPWQTGSAVAKALSALSRTTDMRPLTDLGTLKSEDEERYQALRQDLAKSPAPAAAELRLKAGRIKSLLDALNAIAQRTKDDALDRVIASNREAYTTREAATLAARTLFEKNALPGVGGDVWRELWESARRYSTTIAYPEAPFPPTEAGTRCVLCQQPLDNETAEQMLRFEAFIKDDTARTAATAERLAVTSRDELRRLAISLRPLRDPLAELSLLDSTLIKPIRKWIAVARVRRFQTLLDISGRIEAPAIPDQQLLKIVKGLEERAEALERSEKSEERQKLQREFIELADRRKLREALHLIAPEVERLKQIHFLDQCISDTTTTAITKVGNEIADAVVTPQLRDRFQEEIVRLAGSKVRVEIVRSGGRYGSPQYQVKLFARPDAKVASILSEGEKTCVALAAFLTELATGSHNSTLVFDDPVSSLDHRWRKNVASRLVDEAATRQIIVFTHDLVFVNDLEDAARNHKIACALFNLNRGSDGMGIVEQGLPWRAKSVEDRLDKLEKQARSARDLYDDNNEDEYRSEAANIYNLLRATWERALEDVAFFRVIQRHRDYINTKDLKKVSVLSEVDCDLFLKGFAKCCGVVDAHDPSRGRGLAPWAETNS